MKRDTCSTPDQTERQLLEQIFPLPTREEMLNEIYKLLPYPHFGVTGGYGFTRRHLCLAVERDDMAAAADNWFTLIHQSIIECINMYAEPEDDSEPAEDVSYEQATEWLSEYVATL